MNKKLIAGLSVLLVVLGASTDAFAYGGGHHGGRMGGGNELSGMFFFKAHKVLEMKKELGLSAEQVEAVRNLKLDVKKALIRHRANIDILNIDLYSQLKNDTKNTAVITKLIDEKFEIQKSEAMFLTESYVKLNGTLNDKQLETLKSLFEARKKEGGHFYSHVRTEKS